MSSILNKIDVDRFIRSFAYSIIIAIALGILLLLGLLITGLREFVPYLLTLYTLGYGGLLLTIAGCIGPGRYKRRYKLLIFQPSEGSSFTTDIPISGFVIDDDIEEIEVHINDQLIRTVKLENSKFQIEVGRGEFVQQEINAIWLEHNGEKSNKVNFTTFDISEDMDEDEVDQLVSIDKERPSKTLEEAKSNYLDSISGGTGSLSLGMGAASLLIFIIGIIMDLVLNTRTPLV